MPHMRYVKAVFRTLRKEFGGTLEGVKTIVGYVRSRSGKKWIVVFFINHSNAKLGQAAQDALIEWLPKWY